MKTLNTKQQNALTFLDELVSYKRRWSAADRSRYNRIVRFIKGK